MAKIKDIQDFLEKRIPKELSFPGDNDGFALIPDSEAELTKVVLALDVTLKSIEFARSQGAQLIVAHHPTVFSPLYSIRDTDPVGKRLLTAAAAGIALAGFHTRLDAIEGGVNDCLARLLGITVDGTFDRGLGRVGTLEVPISYSDFGLKLKALLGTDQITGMDLGRPVHRVAIVGGSGKGSFFEAYNTGADTFLTGEVNHSTLLDARDLGINLICATHYHTEVVVLPALEAMIKEEFPQVEIRTFYDKL